MRPELGDDLEYGWGRDTEGMRACWWGTWCSITATCRTETGWRAVGEGMRRSRGKVRQFIRVGI